MKKILIALMFVSIPTLVGASSYVYINGITYGVLKHPIAVSVGMPVAENTTMYRTEDVEKNIICYVVVGNEGVANSCLPNTK